MSAARWNLLVESLGRAGVEAKVDEKSYAQTERGRVVHGVSRSITLRTATGGLVQVGDKWWSKNPNYWLGYEVVMSNADDIVTASLRATKVRSHVVDHVLDLLAVGAVTSSPDG